MPEDNIVEQFLGFVLHGALVVMLLLFALNFSVRTGERGFFPHDQSIMFDGAHRIVSGQSPYVDFVMPFGPMAFWVQTVFTRASGLNHFSCVASAAVVNVLATLLTVLTVRQLFPRRKSLSYLAGFLTSIWFTGPFGTLWMDHVAFFFSLFAILTTLYGLPISKDGRTADLLFVLSGCGAFLSIVAKQNIGFFMLPLCPVMLGFGLAPNKKRIFTAIGLFIAGLTGALAAFLVWLLVASSPSAFWIQSVRMAGQLGMSRLFGDFWGLVVAVVFGRGPAFIRIVTTIILALSVSVLSFHLRNRRIAGFPSPVLLLPPLLCIFIILGQRLSILTSANQPLNGFPLIGLILATVTGMLLHLFNSDDPRIKQLIDGLKPFTRRDARTIMVASVLLSSLYICISGLNTSFNRDVQDSVTGSSFPQYMTHPKLLSLRWGNPTMVGDREVTERDVANILTYLTQSRKNFFVFPDFTFFYGVVGVPSPQPLLYFAPGETYPSGGDARLDSLVVDQLKKNSVEIVILEEKSVSDAEQILTDFPLLKSFIDETYIKIGKMGIFHIHKKPEFGSGPDNRLEDLPG